MARPEVERGDITGLERLQEIFAIGSNVLRFTDACSVSGLLVVIKFQDLIRRAAPYMTDLRFPLLASAHDYNFICEITSANDDIP